MLHNRFHRRLVSEPLLLRHQLPVLPDLNKARGQLVCHLTLGLHEIASGRLRDAPTRCSCEIDFTVTGACEH